MHCQTDAWMGGYFASLPGTVGLSWIDRIAPAVILHGMHARILEEKGQNIDSRKLMWEFTADSQRGKPNFGQFV